jgi:hypothetical protein
VNVLRLLILTTLPLLISGCGALSFFKEDVKPVEIQTKAVARQPLNLPDPEPFTAPSNVRFIVITRETADSVFSDLITKDMDPVVYALTDRGYEELSLTIAELRNLIATQRSIIQRYREYYEPKQ